MDSEIEADVDVMFKGDSLGEEEYELEVVDGQWLTSEIDDMVL